MCFIKICCKKIVFVIYNNKYVVKLCINKWKTKFPTGVRSLFRGMGGRPFQKVLGVYAILRIERRLGLPMHSDALYIGKTRNLRRRMGNHLDPATAHNEQVDAINDRESLEFWCNLMPGDQLTAAEKTSSKS